MNKKVVVLGAGITGLTVAWKLLDMGHSVELIELNDHVGGLASCIKYGGYLLDLGPHRIYTPMSHVLNEIKSILGDDLLTLPKKSKIRLFGKYFDYPFKMKELIFKINPLISFKCGFSYLGVFFKNKFTKKEDKTYEEYIVNRFGKALYNLVFKPIAEKTWGNPIKLSSDIAKIRVTMPNLLQMIKNILTGNRYQPEISSKLVYYPKKATMQLPEKIAELIVSKRGKIHLESKPVSINLKNNISDSAEFVNVNNKKIKIKADYIVSTIPLTALSGLFNPTLPEDIIKNIKSLKFRNLILLYVAVNKEKIMDEQWSIFPESKFIFNRLSEQKNYSNFVFPKEKTVLTADIPCDEGGEIWNLSNKQIFERAIRNYEGIGLIKRDDVDSYHIVRLKDVYPIYDVNYKQRLDIVMSHLYNVGNFMTLGRRGIFNYNNMDHCIDMSIIAAEHISHSRPKEEWAEKREHFNTYKLID